MLDDNLKEQELGDAYSRISPPQRAAITRLFQEGLQHSGLPATQPVVLSVDPETATPEQLATLHLYARQNDAKIVLAVMSHPIARIALGAFATNEINRQAGEITPM